jgi:hypothetical protein
MPNPHSRSDPENAWPATIARMPSNTYDGGSRWAIHCIHDGSTATG